MKHGTKKVLWGLTAIILLLLVLAASGLGYLYRNPSRVKDAVARTISGVSGYDVQINTLSWDTGPLRLRAEGIQVASPDDPGGGVQLAIRALEVEMHLEGDFGKRILVIDRAGVQGARLALEGVPALPGTGVPKAGDPSLAARVGAGLLSRLLFSDVRIARAELEEGRAEVKTGTATLWLDRIQAGVTAQRDIHASCEARIEHPGLDLLLDLPRINAEADLKDDRETVKARFSIEDGALRHPGGTVPGVSLECSGEFHTAGRRIRMDTFDLHLPDLRPFLPVSLHSALEVAVSASGTALPREQRLESAILCVTLRSPPAEFDIETGIKLSWDPILKGALEDITCRFRPADWIPLLPAEYRKPLAGIDVSGLFRLSGGMEASLDNRGLHFEPDLALRLEENRISLSSPPLEAGGRISGEFRLFGPWPDLMISADIRAGELAMEHPAARIPLSEAEVRLSGRPAEIHLQKADLRIPELHVTVPEKPLLLRDMRLQAGKGLLYPFIPSGDIPEIRVEAEGLGPVLVEARLRNKKAVLSAHGQKTGLASFLSGDGRPFHGWNLTGRDSIHVRAETGDSGTWNFSARLDFEELSFENDEIEAFAEGLGLSLKADGTAGGDGPVLVESLNLGASSGEVLFGRFYLNMKTRPFSVNARTRLDFDPLRILDSTLDAGIEDLVSIRVSGNIEQAGESFRAGLALSLPPFRLKPAFQVFAVEPFGMKMPILNTMSVHGEASADLRLRRDAGGFSLTGEARVRDGGLSAEEPALALEGASLSLPVRYGTIADGRGVTPLNGKLTIRTLRIPLLPEQSLALDLEALPNHIRVPGHTRLMIPGGGVRLGPLDITHDTDKGLGLRSSLHLDDVNLGPLLAGFWADAPEGRVKGSLAPIVYRDGTITSHGALEAEVFGGSATIENLGASGVFTPTPVFGLDARWEGLNLEQMTSGTAFGRITGILDGHIKGFELAYGQPQRFYLLMETVRQKGVDQRISVRAVDNIAQIGGGGSPFVGMAGYFTSLFREFPYERIGVRAVLESDIFQINGTIMEGGKEYLIKRSGFSGVNVVNQNPDNRIGFKDMVKRIQRVTASHDGPVIQ
ncbi:MAG: hypothetical protein R6V25_07725 [Desulfatiglandales bacterium]